METVPATCDHVIPTMTVQANTDVNGNHGLHSINDFTDFIAAIQMIDIVLTQNASEALNGVFTIAFMGHVTPPFSHDVTPAEV